MRSKVLLALVLVANNLHAASAWHDNLSFANGGYWPRRIAITVTNTASEPVSGDAVELAVPALSGEPVASIRACQQDGVELLFDLKDESNALVRTGALDRKTRFLIPIDCSATNMAIIYVYAGNAEAWPAPDFLKPEIRRANATLRASVGEVEHLALQRAEALADSSRASNSAEVLVRNLTEGSISSALVRFDTAAARARLPGLPLSASARASLADGTELPTCELGRDVFFHARLNPHSEHRFQVRFQPDRPRDERSGYAELLGSRVNLAPNGDFDSGENAPAGWFRSGVTTDTIVTTGFSSDARFGRRGVEVSVRENPRQAWIGWTSQEIPVRAGAMYLLSGWLRPAGLQGSATIHAHFHNRTGALTQSGAMTSTQPAVGGTSEWVNSRGLVQAPPDAVSIQLHLTMNSTGQLRHDGIVLVEVVDGRLAAVHGSGDSPSVSPLDVWEVNPLVKVFPETPAQKAPAELRVQLARNEYEPIQLALRQSSAQTGNVEITVSTPRSDAGRELPGVKIDRVGFVPVDQASAYYTTQGPDWQRKVPRGAPTTDGWAGWWPDPLASARRLELTANRTQPIWLTVHAPTAAEPGMYRAVVTIKPEDAAPLVMPLTIEVLPFLLPQRTQLRALFDLRFGPGGGFGSAAASGEQRRAWWRFLAEHRLGVDSIEPPPKFRYENGQVSMDAREFDEAAHFCFDELGMNVCYTPQFFYMFGWAYPPKKFFGLEPFTPEWTRAFKQAYRLFTEHLRAKGWHDRFVYYISDEPHFQHDFVVAQMQKLCALIHEVDPELPIYSSTWRHCAAWDNALDLWGIGQYGCFPVEDMQALQRAGKRMWFTCDGQMATDTPFLATERMLPYYCFKYGVQGFEFWGVAWWTYDPWQIGWHQFIRQSDEGQKYYWIRYPNGDGYLTYPGKPVGVDGPVSTIRLEQVREGLEDYEAMTLLAERSTAARQGGQPSRAAERALGMARDLVSIPNAGGLRSTEILPDPDRIRQIRRAVNAALVELTR